MKFLANEPMMQFLMHPFHRNDLTGSNAVYYELFSGGPLTQAELDYMNSAFVRLTTGYLSGRALSLHLRANRTFLAHGPASGVYQFNNKSHYGSPDTKAFLMSQRSDVMTIMAQGQASLAYVVVYPGGNWESSTRFAFLLSVGDLNSDAEVKMENTNIVTGGRYRLNDIIINVSGLLGE